MSLAAYFDQSYPPELWEDAPAADTFPAGVSLYGQGHSYVAGEGASDSAHRFLTRLGELLGAGSVSNRGVPGAAMPQIVHAIATGVGGVTPWTPGTRGLVVLDGALNDVLHTTSERQAQDAVGFGSALRTALRILRAGSLATPADGSITYTGGTPGSFADEIAPGGAARVLSAGQAASVAGYTATEIVVLGFAFALTTGEPPATVAVDGTTYGTLTATDLAAASGPITGGKGDGASYSYQLHAWRVTGLPAGAKTVTVTGGPGGGSFYFCGYLTPSETPPSVLVVQDAPLLDYAGSPWSKAQGDALLAARNDTIASVCAEQEFADRAAVRVGDASVGYDPVTMLAGDHWHRNDAGHEALAQALRTVAATFPVRPGLI